MLLLLFVSLVSGLQFLPHRARGGIAWHSEKFNYAHETASAETHWFNQLLDHNEPSAGVFSQRYFVDKSLWNGGPVFLEINGEGTMKNGFWYLIPLGPASPPSGFIRDLAKQHNALMIGLEHRFYGESVPNKDFSVQNLKYLTTRQVCKRRGRNSCHKPSDAKRHLRTWIVLSNIFQAALDLTSGLLLVEATLVSL
jgi:serine protease 16